jgi:uncharacterized cupin superfamily protein
MHSSNTYRIQTTNTSLVPEVLSHPLDSTVQRHQLNLSDPCGLRQGGVHLVTVLPHNTSSVPHWHSTEDEWFYIIKAGPDTRIILHDASAESREEPVQPGEFYGFPAASKTAHAFKTGETELVYLSGGSRKELEIVHYPGKSKRIVLDRTGSGRSWTTDETHVKETKVPERPIK